MTKRRMKREKAKAKAKIKTESEAGLKSDRIIGRKGLDE